MTNPTINAMFVIPLPLNNNQGIALFVKQIFFILKPENKIIFESLLNLTKCLVNFLLIV